MTDSRTLKTEPVSRTYVSQGLRLHYLDWENPGAPLVILLHGARDHAHSWDWTAPALQLAGWRVVALDWRGHGDSDWSPDSAYIASYHVLDLADLVEHLAAPRFAIVGHSFGGLVGSRYAAMYPERVTKLVLVDGMGPARSVFKRWDEQGSVFRTREWVERRRAMAGRPPPCFATVEEAAARMAAGNPQLKPEQAQHLARHGVRPCEGGWTWKSDPLMNVFPPEDFTAETPAVLAAIACPTLIFWAPKSYTDHPDADGRAALIKDRRIIVYEDAGHWLHQERPEDFAADVREFLR